MPFIAGRIVVSSQSMGWRIGYRAGYGLNSGLASAGICAFNRLGWPWCPKGGGLVVSKLAHGQAVCC